MKEKDLGLDSPIVRIMILENLDYFLHEVEMVWQEGEYKSPEVQKVGHFKFRPSGKEDKVVIEIHKRMRDGMLRMDTFPEDDPRYYDTKDDIWEMLRVFPIENEKYRNVPVVRLDKISSMELRHSHVSVRMECDVFNVYFPNGSDPDLAIANIVKLYRMLKEKDIFIRLDEVNMMTLCDKVNPETGKIDYD